MAETCSDSERAGQIIATLTRLHFLSLKEKLLLLKNCPYKTLVKRLLELAFKGHVFRADIGEFNTKKTTTLKGADARLSKFIRLNEMFFADEISAPRLVARMKRILSKLHVREYAFYQDLLSGGTCYLDYLTFRKVFLKAKDDAELVRFMRPCEANREHAWGGKQFVVQPNYQGIQLRIILEKGKKPRLVGRDQLDYAGRMKGTLKTAKGFLQDYGVQRIEFDGILVPKDKRSRPFLDWKASECNLYIYDTVDEKLPLKRRLRIVKAFCTFMKQEGNKRILLMPTEVVSGATVGAEAKSYSRASNPYCTRNGIIVKRWDSAYEFKRSPNWLTLAAFNDNESGIFLGRATLVGFAPGGTKLLALDNNSLELEIEGSTERLEPLYKYLGYTVEFAYIRGYLSFRRVLYDKGREV